MFIFYYKLIFVLLIFTGILHKLRRKIIEPLFNSKFLLKYVSYIDICSSQCMDLLEKEVSCGPVDIKPYIKRYTMDAFLGNDYI